MRILQCKLTTIEAMLGTASNNKELHSEFIASHAPDAPSREEEIEAVGVEEVIEKGMTVFSRNRMGAHPVGLPNQRLFQDCLRRAAEGEGDKEQQNQSLQEGN